MSQSVEDVLHDKALDALGHLIAHLEAGKIAPQTFKSGVEIVWMCLGGVVKSNDFNALMQEANAYVRGLGDQPMVQVLTKSDSLVVLMRDRENVRLLASSKHNERVRSLETEDDAVTYTADLCREAVTKGFHELKL